MKDMSKVENYSTALSQKLAEVIKSDIGKGDYIASELSRGEYTATIILALAITYAQIVGSLSTEDAVDLVKLTETSADIFKLKFTVELEKIELSKILNNN